MTDYAPHNERPEDPKQPLKGRRAIVTGAGNGLGLAIAHKFVTAGARILLVDCDAVVTARTSEAGFPAGTAFALTKDLADNDAASTVFQEAQKALGSVDTLINNAAWSLHKPMLDMTLAEFDRLAAINQRAPYFLAQELLRTVSKLTPRPKDPAIVNIASVNALAGNPNLVAYAGTKGALLAMTRAMAVEMAAVGIRVNCVSPGAVYTPMTQKVIAEGALNADALVNRYLIKRFSSCEEIADLVAYLCGPTATYVTGANWIIDGGFLAQ